MRFPDQDRTTFLHGLLADHISDVIGSTSLPESVMGHSPCTDVTPLKREQVYMYDTPH